jgi:hypothetical protein
MDEILLLSFEINKKEASPGACLFVTLSYEKPLAWIGENRRLFLCLILL